MTMMNPNYNGRIADFHFIPKVPAKIYFADICGREVPKTYEWGLSGLSKEIFLKNLGSCLEESLHNGVPHLAVAFPHITHVIRFGDPRYSEQETNLYNVWSASTPRIIKGNFELENDNVLTCPLELAIFAEEGLLWGTSQDVTSYLSKRVDPHLTAKVQNPNKLKDYLAQKI